MVTVMFVNEDLTEMEFNKIASNDIVSVWNMIKDFDEFRCKDGILRMIGDYKTLNLDMNRIEIELVYNE